MRAQASRYNRSELRIINNKIKRERELVRHILIFIFAIILFFSILFIVGNSKSMASDGSEDILYKYYTNVRVNPGETLYDIASNYIVENKLTAEEFIEEVVYINNLKSADRIISGTYLIVPYYDVYNG